MSNTPSTCAHCQQSYPKGALSSAKIHDQELYFCCKGCEGVYRFLHDQNLQDFYSLLKNPIAPPRLDSRSMSLESFDSASFYQNFVLKNSQGFHQVSFVIEGIHCSACIQLIERALAKLEGIYEAPINYTNHKLKIIFDAEILKLSEAVRLLRALGYDLTPYDPKVSESKNHRAQKKEFFSLVVAIFCTMNIMWVAVSQYAGYFLDSSQVMKDALNAAAFLLATPVLFYTGRDFYKNAYYQLKHKAIGMDFLVITGASLTYLYSIYAGITRSGETYFEAVAMIICFVFAGKFLETRVKKNAGDALDGLSLLLPQEVICLENGKKIPQAPQNVKVDSIIEIPPYSIIPIDGILLDEKAMINTQNISGEPIPKLFYKHQEILSGASATAETLQIQTKKLFSHSLLFSLIDTLENSLQSKPQISNYAQKISLIFSPIVLALALCGGLFWYFWLDAGLESALMIAISVIVISCPCALALATPIACIAGVNEACRHKIIFKKSRTLEHLAKAKYVVFDKTGTLTQGHPEVKESKIFAAYEKTLLQSLLLQAAHPIAKGVKAYISNPNDSAQDLIPISQDYTEVLGMGIKARCKGQNLLAGSLEFLEQNQVQGMEGLREWSARSLGFFGFSVNGILCQAFLLEDSIKEDASALIANLCKQGIECVVLSGDREANVAKVCRELGISTYYAGKLPHQKAQIIQELSQKLAAQSTLVMVGDGVNDTLALSQSGVGISFLSALSLASKSSDIILLKSDIPTLQKAFYLSARTLQIIKQNLLFSLVYNVCLIPLALCGLILPLFAALSMSASSLIVVLNSLRIKAQ